MSYNGPERGAMVREEFGATEVTARMETASTAVAAQARAQVEARYVVAMKRPRNWNDVRVSLIDDCKRPSFAKVAMYLKPVGAGVKGPSIRFAEAALRSMTNCYPETQVIYDDFEKRIVRQSVTDLEANLTYSKDIVIEKTVERKTLKPGQVPLRTRQNSAGELTYLVAATEDELLTKENALVSKALRTNALRLLPGDILDECMAMVQRVAKDKAAQDPDAAKKALMDAFSDLGIKPSEIEAYLAHSIDSIQPAEIVELQALYQGIKSGDATWRDAMEMKHPSGDDEQPNEAQSKLRGRIEERLRKSAKKDEPGKEGS